VLRFGAAAVEAAAVTPARVLIVQGRATGDATLLRQAERHLEAAWELAEGHGLGWLRLRVLILRALLADAVGDRDAALASLAAAVAQAEPEGVIRPFLDERAPMAALLADLGMRARAGRSNAEMAAELFVEQSTVKTHLIHLYSKLGVHSRTQAAPARSSYWTDPGRRFHPGAPPSGGRASTRHAARLPRRRSPDQGGNR
jgi:hypothetical protein